MNESLQRLFRWMRARGRDTEVGEEYSGYVSQSPSHAAGTAETYNLGPESPVRLSPIPVSVNSQVGIAYSGVLESQADKVYVRCGEGPGAWRNVRDIPMQQESESSGWFAEVQTGQESCTLEFCFHDGAGNWDNNDGRNWSVTVNGK